MAIMTGNVPQGLSGGAVPSPMPAGPGIPGLPAPPMSGPPGAVPGMAPPPPPSMPIMPPAAPQPKLAGENKAAAKFAYHPGGKAAHPGRR